MYVTGRGVTEDRKKAAHWFSGASKLGLEMAGDNLNKLGRDKGGFGLLSLAVEHGTRTTLLTRDGSDIRLFDLYIKPLI